MLVFGGQNAFSSLQLRGARTNYEHFRTCRFLILVSHTHQSPWHLLRPPDTVSKGAISSASCKWRLPPRRLFCGNRLMADSVPAIPEEPLAAAVPATIRVATTGRKRGAFMSKIAPYLFTLEDNKPWREPFRASKRQRINNAKMPDASRVCFYWLASAHSAIACSTCSSAKRLRQTSADKGKSDEIAVGSVSGGRNFFCPQKWVACAISRHSKIACGRPSSSSRRGEICSMRTKREMIKF